MICVAFDSRLCGRFELSKDRVSQGDYPETTGLEPDTLLVKAPSDNVKITLSARTKAATELRKPACSA